MNFMTRKFNQVTLRQGRSMTRLDKNESDERKKKRKKIVTRIVTK